MIYWSIIILAAISACLLAYSILFRSWICVGAGTLLLLTALGLSTLWIPIIRSNAEQVAAGRPYCLALPSRHRPIQSSLELSPLFAHGSRLSPHLMLWLKDGNSTKAYTWSYRQTSFVAGLPEGVMRNCHPREGFLTGLPLPTAGAYFSLPQGDFVIPVEYSPTHINDELITFVVSQDFPPGLTKVGVVWNDWAVQRWRDFDMKDNSVPPIKGGSRRTDGPYGYDIRKYDDEGRLIERFGCNMSKSCRLEIWSGSFLFDIYLPLTDPQDAEGIASKIKEIWTGFRQVE